VDDEASEGDGNASESGQEEGGIEDYPSGDEGGSVSSGSSAERARERAKQQEEADAAAEGGVEEGELLDEEEGALASGDDKADPEATAEPMDEDDSGRAADGFAGGLNFHALAEDQPSPSGGGGGEGGETEDVPSVVSEKGGPVQERPAGEVLSELHAVGRNTGRDVTYKVLKGAEQGPIHAVQVLMGGRVVGEGHGPNKRQAKVDGAKRVLEMLRGREGWWVAHSVSALSLLFCILLSSFLSLGLRTLLLHSHSFLPLFPPLRVLNLWVCSVQRTVPCQLSMYVLLL
jgi:hypothetical protein